MKLVKHLFKKYKLLFACILALSVIVGLSFYTRYLVDKFNMAEKYKVVAPALTLSSEENFISKAYFNNVPGEDIALNPILDIIHNAKYSIEVAMFSFDSLKLKQGLYEAAARGVKVTLILDASRSAKHDMIFSDLPASIKRIDLGGFNPDVSAENIYMHHKLLIADRGYDTEEIATGSMDYTSKGEKYEQGFFMISPDKVLAKIYESEMDLLKSGITGVDKLKQKDYYPWAAHIKYADSYVDVWISPGFNENSVQNKIVEEIAKAQKSINVIMWQFTDKVIADALIEKAKNGVPVKIITEDLVANDLNSKIPYIKNIAMSDKINNIEIVLDTKLANQMDLSKMPTGFSPFIHHHFMIIDNSTLIFSTSNWSIWGFYKNDEDTIITDNKYLITEFQKTFDYFYKILK